MDTIISHKIAAATAFAVGVAFTAVAYSQGGTWWQHALQEPATFGSASTSQPVSEPAMEAPHTLPV